MQAVALAFPSSTVAMVSRSSTVTMPVPWQSPVQGGVGLGVSVAVAVGVSVVVGVAVGVPVTVGSA